MLFNHKNNRNSSPAPISDSASSVDYFEPLSGSYENDDNDLDDDDDDDDDDEEDDEDDEDDEDEDEDEDDMYSTIFGHYFSLSKFKVEESNAVSRVIRKEAYCFDFKKFAEKLVEATFEEANKVLMQDENTITSGFIPCFNVHGEAGYFENYEETVEESRTEYEDDLSTTSSSFWPKISEFNIKLGLEKIEYYVNQWQRSSEWKFCVEFLGFECEDCSNIFVFEVEWSKPTMSYPIPQATASVYFAMEVYKMVPPNSDRCTEVTYIFECSNVIHNPGRINFQEKWLEDIIEAKLKFFKTITFSVRNIFLRKTHNFFRYNLEKIQVKNAWLPPPLIKIEQGIQMIYFEIVH